LRRLARVWPAFDSRLKIKRDVAAMLSGFVPKVLVYN
jgi:hypothetical protein